MVTSSAALLRRQGESHGEPAARRDWVASRCTECEVTVFPASPTPCRCCGGEVVTVELPDSGTVETWTSNGAALIAEVRLTSGVLVLGSVREERIAVGDQVRLDGSSEEVAFRRR